MKVQIKQYRRTAMQYALIVLYAILTALIYEIFVFPNAFAPAGLNGFATMVQHLFGFEVGALSLIINLPMLVVAFFVLGRTYAKRTLTYTVVFSVALIFLERVDISRIIFQAQTTGDAILAAVAGGLFNGALYSLSVKAGGSTGGTDVIGAFINHRHPEYDTVWIIFLLNVAVAAVSFFVYDMQYQPVILCAVYVFASSKVSDSIFKGARMAAKFEVITTQPKELAEELMQTLNHGCTVITVRGMYTGAEKSMLVCVVNPRQVVDFEKVIRKYDSTFAYISTVNGTVGQFQKVK
ncbi:MAG: YitT family protein [Clostridia bacterium]|nr:YitT family protein [Clostridia bacterium]